MARNSVIAGRDISEAALIGYGGFKTAQLAQLTLSPLRPNGIGSEPCQDIIVKRFYIPSKKADQLPAVNDPKDDPKRSLAKRFPRLSVPDELEKLYREANILYWAKSLLQLTYDFIDRAISKAATLPPFDIPRLCFIDAGLLLAVKPNENNAKSSGTANVQTPYLAEELIPNSKSFMKYVHNSEPYPLPEPDEPGYDLAQFLCFTQHIQYVKTGGLAYITDYQGSGALLTDPQILTHPSVNAGKDLFGEGNLVIGVKLFAREHICNAFCRWPGFKLDPPASVDIDF
ncbi:hypothetical protein JVT61DRAFT_11413 [Boletus reticuloceps]|uniref:Alpha-type protein kinase domain-containing protein n=1 Tax=Boletus reticuloceps TaxID=495285 RepID=A0A8I2YEK8_9AGAM|nr:hypothetical protein JVT61DRAFT_11413 [Boletus reticuloceps]